MELQILFEKSKADLEFVYNSLDVSFAAMTAENPGAVNPFRLLNRVSKLQEELEDVRNSMSESLEKKKRFVQNVKVEETYKKLEELKRLSTGTDVSIEDNAVDNFVELKEKLEVLTFSV